MKTPAADTTTLQHYIDELSVTGLTSPPTIRRYRQQKEGGRWIDAA